MNDVWMSAEVAPMIRYATLLLPLLAGCPNLSTDGEDLGGVSLCLVGPAPAEPPDSDTTVTVVQGRVVGVGDGAPADPTEGSCLEAGRRFRTVDIEDAQGERWTFAWSAWSGEDDRTPALPLAVEDEVTLRFLTTLSFAQSWGATVTGPDGLVLALDSGMNDTFARAEEEISGLTVSVGDEVGASEPTDCGPRRRLELLFEGDDAVTLDVWEEGQVTVDGAVLEARNAGAWTYTGSGGCLDAWGPIPWLVWRP